MAGFALVDAPRCGAENMAIDQLMLEFAAARQEPLLRVYQWSAPTVSLGYFQKLSDYRSHASSAAPSVVRRTTGGGAIVHHHDWTYALALPDTATPLSARTANIGAALPIYDLLHDRIVEWLRGLGWDAAKWQTDCAGKVVNPAACSFLCFERRSRGDVVIDQTKVLGSAQRRARGALLQHGSLLLAQSPYAPTLKGLAELSMPTEVGHHERGLPVGQSPSEFLGVLKSAVEKHFQQPLQVVDALDGFLELCSDAVGRFKAARWLGRV